MLFSLIENIRFDFSFSPVPQFGCLCPFVPAIVRDMTDDEAVIAMADANIQREELLPSEKAFAYKMKLNAMKRQAGRPSKNNVRQNGTNLRSDQELGEQVGESARSIQRYIRLQD